MYYLFASKVPAVLPEEITQLLLEIGKTYLYYLHANAVAWEINKNKSDLVIPEYMRVKQGRFDVKIQGYWYEDLPIVQYRVWCREKLLDEFQKLPVPDRLDILKLFRRTGCWYVFLCCYMLI